jgi:glycosyltransferase involved in cell wall biosynthesis
MRVGIVAGIVVPNDAISAAAAAQADVLTRMPGVESVTLFSHCIARQTAGEARQISDSWTLARDPAFQACDFLIFHWGIHYGLFDVLTLLSDRQLDRTAVHFHNCTPPELVNESARDGIERSIAQFAHAISLGVSMWTFSEFNRQTLLKWGATEKQVSFMPFPIDVPSGLSATRPTEEVVLVSVGRFVPAKGQLTLVDALTRVPPDVRSRLRVDFAGSGTFSEVGYMDAMATAIREADLDDIVRFRLDLTDEELWELYASGHVVVSTSLHEGLCVPIIEGYAVGCRAIGTTAGNLPFLVITPDEVVPPNDPQSLAEAIERIALTWPEQSSDYSQRRTTLAASFSSAECEQRLRLKLFGSRHQ